MTKVVNLPTLILATPPGPPRRSPLSNSLPHPFPSLNMLCVKNYTRAIYSSKNIRIKYRIKSTILWKWKRFNGTNFILFYKLKLELSPNTLKFENLGFDNFLLYRRLNS